jgi:hypothetical protein
VETLSGTRLARWVAYAIHSVLADRNKEVATALILGEGMVVDRQAHVQNVDMPC